ncbi:MAG: sulfoxide reductase heme-binding subunit YedZ [Chloroflexi bacterium]|nr:sulfoxide reductase heme-binding subunit YedZ [Chloroflexota bacterium]
MDSSLVDETGRDRERGRATRLRVLVHGLGLLPAASVLVRVLDGDLGANPIQATEQALGRAALYFLLASLACTPLNTVFGWRELLNHRRTLGLYAFLYASLHFYTFSAVDYGLNWTLSKEAIFDKPFTLVGFIAGFILLVLAITSFDAWKERLGRHWKSLHRLAYLAGGMTILHYTWAKKGNLLSLSGDILQPVLSGLLLLLLLALRIPFIRRRLAAHRSGSRRTR